MDRGYGPFPGGPGLRGGFVEHGGHHGGPHALAWVIFGLLLALLLIAIVSLALDAYYRSQGSRPFVKWLGPGMHPGMFPGGRALAVLNERYARGEISRDEYLRTREDLGGPPADAAEATTEVVPPPEPPPAAGRRRTPKPADS